MRIVFVGAHLDDETYASGTIAKYVDCGHRATIVHATRGGKGHWDIPTPELEKIREEEMRQAANVLGADVRFLDYSDASLKASLPLHETAYPAHRPEPEIFFFGAPMTKQEPDVFIDVSDYMDKKIMSFRKHVSQWQDWGNPPGEKGDYMERLVDGILNDSGNMGDAAEYSSRGIHQ